MPNTGNTRATAILPPIDANRLLMLQAVELARSASSEDGRPRPKVAALVARESAVIGAAYRGELVPGEHAEYTLLQRKLPTQSLDGATLFTTLEPCTTRNHPKRPCVDWIIDRGIESVRVGLLDPNPQVYEQGVIRLRAAGLSVDFFPADIKDIIRADNKAFIDQFMSSPDLAGTVSFNYTHNDGAYAFGHGDLTFKTRWTSGGGSAIYSYTDRTGLRGLGLALSARSFADVRDATAYDMSSRVRLVREGEFIVFQNAFGNYAVARIIDVKARGYDDPYDAVTLEYRINADGSARFSS